MALKFRSSSPREELYLGGEGEIAPIFLVLQPHIISAYDLISPVLWPQSGVL